MMNVVVLLMVMPLLLLLVMVMMIHVFVYVCTALWEKGVETVIKLEKVLFFLERGIDNLLNGLENKTQY